MPSSSASAAAVHRAGSAERHERGAARVVTAPHGDDVQGPGHRRVGDAEHRVTGLGER